MKNPILQLQAKFNEWQKQIFEAAEKDRAERAELIGRIEAMEERISELEVFLNHMDGFEDDYKG